MEVRGQPTILEPSLCGVEHHRVLEILVAWLREGGGTGAVASWQHCLVFVLAGSGDVELQTLSKVCLVEVEAWRSAVEANLLSNLLLEIRSTSLLNPLTLTVRVVLETGCLVLNTKLILVLHDNFTVKCLGNELLAWDALRCQQTHVWVLFRVVQVKPVSGGCEN